MLQRLLHVHFQHVMDVLVLEADLQGLAVEAAALADGTSPTRRPKSPSPGGWSRCLAGLAAAAGAVEAEAARLVAADLGLGGHGVQAADVVEELDVGGGVGARRAAMGDWSMSMTLSICSARRCRRSAGPLTATCSLSSPFSSPFS